MSRWLQSIGNALERLDDGAAEAFRAVAESDSDEYDDDEEAAEEYSVEEEDDRGGYSQDEVEGNEAEADLGEPFEVGAAAEVTPEIAPPHSAAPATTAAAPVATGVPAPPVGGAAPTKPPPPPPPPLPSAAPAPPSNSGAARPRRSASTSLPESDGEDRAARRRLEVRVAALEAELARARAELAAQAAELGRAAEDVQEERRQWREDRRELLVEQDRERRDWERRAAQARREQADAYEAQVQALREQVRSLERQDREQQTASGQSLQAAEAREAAAQAEIQELQARETNLRSELAASQRSVRQLEESVQSLTGALEDSQAKERAAELALDDIRGLHQQQLHQQKSRVVELERTVEELGAGLIAAQQRPVADSNGKTDSTRITPATAVGEENSEKLFSSTSWQHKYEALVEDMDTLRAQHQLAVQRCQVLEAELQDLQQERAAEQQAAHETQRQHEAAMEAMALNVNRLERVLKEDRLNPSAPPAAAGSGASNLDLQQNAALQRALREADQAKHQLAAMSDQIMRQQRAVEASKAEILALKGRLHIANTRADAAESQLSTEARERGAEIVGPYGPTPSKLRRRVKGGWFGRGYAGRSMRNALGLRVAPPGSVQEQLGSTVDTFDRWLLETGSILKNEPLARVAFAAYLAILHMWCFALVAFHTIQSEKGDINNLRTRRHEAIPFQPGH